MLKIGKTSSQRLRLRKNVIGIRHGEALHNILDQKYGSIVYEQFGDTTLTVKGMYQAIDSQIPPPDLVLVSPLTRTLHTANLMFPETRTVALECLKEYPQHINNRRSPISTISQIFPSVDFSQCEPDPRYWPNNAHPLSNLQEFDARLSAYEEDNIAVVTHSAWLHYFMSGQIDAQHELQHCFPYILCSK